MDILQCVRCGHAWYQRKPGPPRRCAGCKAVYWDRPPRIPKVYHLGPVGAPIKYPFHYLEVGKSILIPWYVNTEGRDFKKILSLRSALSSHARRHGKKFSREGRPNGLFIIRLK